MSSRSRSDAASSGVARRSAKILTVPAIACVRSDLFVDHDLHERLDVGTLFGECLKRRIHRCDDDAGRATRQKLHEFLAGGKPSALHQVRHTYGAKFATVGVARVGGAVVVSAEPDVTARFRSVATIGFIAIEPIRVGTVVAFTMIATQ